jgi:hypothetical protein
VKKHNQIPKDAKPRANNHLAEGEATGHYHAATAPDAVVFDLPGIPDTLALAAPSGTEVTHQEHGTIMVPAGNYSRSIVNEYDHFTEEARQVVD